MINEFNCDCDIIHEDLVKAALDAMPTDNRLYDLSDFFRVLGDSTRVKILWALDDAELCVCDIAAVLNMTKSAISHQLAKLKAANLVKRRRDGKIMYYSLADEHVSIIIEKGLEHTLEITGGKHD